MILADLVENDPEADFPPDEDYFVYIGLTGVAGGCSAAGGRALKMLDPDQASAACGEQVSVGVRSKRWRGK